LLFAIVDPATAYVKQPLTVSQRLDHDCGSSDRALWIKIYLKGQLTYLSMQFPGVGLPFPFTVSGTLVDGFRIVQQSLLPLCNLVWMYAKLPGKFNNFLSSSLLPPELPWL